MKYPVEQRTQILIAGGNQLFVIAPQQRRRSLFWRSFWRTFWWSIFLMVVFFILVGIFA